MRLLAGIVVGAIIAFAGVFAVEWIGHQIFPMPGGIPIDPEGMKAMVASLPFETLASVVAAWVVGALAGAFVADKIALRALAGWIVVALLIAATVANLLAFPHPLWMAVCGMVLPLVCAWIAQRLARVPF